MFNIRTTKDFARGIIDRPRIWCKKLFVHGACGISATHCHVDITFFQAFGECAEVVKMVLCMPEGDGLTL